MPGLVEQQQQPGAGGSAGAAKPGGGSSGALAAAQRSPPVEWGRELAQLAAGEEWAELAGELEASAGGGALVAALMRRALRAVQQAAEAAAAAEGQQAGAGAPAPLPGGATAGRLVAAAQQVAWEKLHSGCWHEVGVAWRDAYSLACLLAAAAAMLWPPPAPPAAGQAEAGAAQAEGLRAALRELDMAAIMGGPLFRPAIDRLISRLQDAWQRLAAPQHAQQAQQQQPASGAGATAAAGAAAGASGDTGGATRGAQPMEAEGGGSGSGSGGGGSEEEGSGALVEAVEAGPVGLGSHGPVPLPPGSMGPRGTPVPLEELPSLERFWREYMHREGGSIPVLIEGGMENWPALSKWQDVKYLRLVAGPRTVPVEVGEHYLADQWGQKLMTLQDFIDRHILGPATAAGAAPAAGPAAGAEVAAAPCCGAPAPAPAPAQRGYLAQHPLFEQIPQLASDIREPDYCCLGEGELQSVNAWFGPAGTVTPLHTDPHHNLLCQVVGRKYIRFYRPEDTEAMYPFSEGLTTNSSQVDMDHPDPARFPRFASAPFSDCVLSAGQMLYIPPGWWHYVKALDTSFSVSWWWK